MPVSDKPAALVISPEAPYPLDGGGALRTASLVQYLAARYEIDLITFQLPGQNALGGLPPGLVRSCRAVTLVRHADDFPSWASRNTARLIRGRPPLVDRYGGYDATVEGFVDEFQRNSGSTPYEVALVEHFWCAPYLPIARRFSKRVILDLHNVESEWHRACAAASKLPEAVAHYGFARAARRQEREWIPQFDLTLATSPEDALHVEALAPGLPVCIYPNAIPWREVPQREPDHAIAFSANMEYEPNRTALRWFLKKIWPELHRRFPGLILRLIGKNAHAIEDDIHGAANVECTGWVEDTFPHIASAEVCIAPLLSGSGTRLKIIEAWAAGRAVVSTSKGAEGLGAVDGKSILLADTPHLFVESVARLLTNPALRQNIAISGRELFEAKFTWNVVWITLSRCLDGFCE